MTETAAAHYTALAAGGTDALLIAADHALRRELSCRVRENLLGLGLVDDSKTVTIAGGAEAGRGDLLLCTRNDHRLEAGEPGRTLANGDLLRIEAVTSEGLQVRRALDADRETGRRRWTGRQFLYAAYKEAELGYAVTGHVAQGRTVRTGLAVLTGSEDRQHAYVALTRGTHQNTAYVFTTPAKLADPAPAPPGPRTRPLRPPRHAAGHPRPGRPGRPRDDQRGRRACPDHRRTGRSQGIGVPGAAAGPEQRRPPGRPARDLGRPGRARSRTPLPRLARGCAPTGTGPLPPSGKEQWLHRTLRTAELAGLDPAEVLTRAVAERDLAGADDIAAVIDARIRRRHGALVPRPAAAWSAQVPAAGDPGRDRFRTQLAAVMDDRRARIGEHAASASLPWALTALGPVPDTIAPRLAWQQKAAAVGTYRELSGHDHPDDPAGLEPAANSPDLRAAWHAACAALTPDDNPRSRTNGPADLTETSCRIGELTARHRELTARMAERQSPPVPAEDPGPVGPIFPLDPAHSRTAILQPPKPEIAVSPWILERLAIRDLNHEIGD